MAPIRRMRRGNGYRCCGGVLLGMRAGDGGEGRSRPWSWPVRPICHGHSAAARCRCRSRAWPRRPTAELDKPGERSRRKDGIRRRAERAKPPKRRAAAAATRRPAGWRSTEEIAIAPSIPDIKAPARCGGDDLVRLEAIVLPDKRQVPVKPAAILRCPMATARGRVDP